MRKMLNDAGYIIDEEKRYIQASKVKKAIGKLLGRRAAHLLTEQYLIKGRLGAKPPQQGGAKPPQQGTRSLTGGDEGI